MADLFSLDDAKAWLGAAGTVDDDLLAALVRAASDSILALLAHDPRSRTLTETLSGTGGPGLPLNAGPVTAVSEVTINPAGSGDTLDPARLAFDGRMLYRQDGGTFPRGIKNIRVSYTAGLNGAALAPVQLAAKYTLKAMYDARTTDMNASGESWAGVGGSSFWASGPGAVPPQAISLLAPYIQHIKV